MRCVRHRCFPAAPSILPKFGWAIAHTPLTPLYLVARAMHVQLMRPHFVDVDLLSCLQVYHIISGTPVGMGMLKLVHTMFQPPPKVP